MSTKRFPSAGGRWPLAMTGIAMLAVCTGFAAPARADDANLIDSKGYLSLGTFLNRSSLKVRVDGQAGETGTVVDWGNTFGDKDVSRFRLDGVWRITDKHHMRFMFTDYSRSATRTLDQDIQWGDNTIYADSSVTAKTGFSIAEAAYEYAGWRKDTYELALTAGVHYTTFHAKLNVNVDSSGGGAVGELSDKASVDAPLPVFGGHGMWKLGKDFYVNALVQWFALSIDGYDGSILNYRADVTWQPKKWVGIGIGYDSFNVDLKVKKDKFQGKLDWTYQGPQIFYNIAF